MDGSVAGHLSGLSLLVDHCTLYLQLPQLPQLPSVTAIFEYGASYQPIHYMEIRIISLVSTNIKLLKYIDFDIANLLSLYVKRPSMIFTF
jgi:hypothetical protein